MYISALLLQPLSGTCSLNSKEYNANLFMQLNMKPLSLVPMGIGQVTTWHGAPDGYCDLLPVEIQPALFMKMCKMKMTHNQAKFLKFPAVEKLP